MQSPGEARARISDTPSEIEELLLAGYRRMSPRDKLRRVLDLGATLEALAAARLRAQYGPDLAPRELELRLAALRLDPELMRRAFGWDPDTRGY